MLIYEGEYMLRSLRLAVIVSAAVVVAGIGAGTAQAAPAPLTYSQIAALPPQQQAKILDPLRAVADVAGTVGRSQESGVFSGVQIDATAGAVTVYLTDLGRQKAFLAAMRAADAGLDTRPARFARSPLTRAALEAGRDALLAGSTAADLTVESIVVPADGTALHVRVRDTGRAARALPASGAGLAAPNGVPVVLEPASDGADRSRVRDTQPWIAGEALASASTSESAVYSCTSGLPSRRISDNRSFLISAAHCFNDNASVYTGWSGGGFNFIGTATYRDNLDDAIAIDTSSTGITGGREWDGPANNIYNVTGSGWSYNGDMTCQDGFSSKIVCGLLVTGDNITWTGSNGVGHRGVEAHQVNGQTASRPGDSGGLVFSLSGTTRQARGIVSWGGGSTTRWTEAPYIYSQFAMQLAPAA
ncbi:hypothetical protein ACPPVO_31095 [Dactylosporangium sp. McL0621]|uniref:hypothetical protein n=1 Tax=Dactylosporangium sp. McL0621 TaxID=3415678 RepID=UPI003CF36D79